MTDGGETAGDLAFVVVDEALQPCPYLPGRTARMPLRLALGRPSPARFDRLLEEGDRRAGPLLYRTECPDCRACEPLRVPVDRFQPSKSQRRVWRRNEGVLEVETGPALATRRRVQLYNRHALERGLARDERRIGLAHYRLHYVESCVRTLEVRYREGRRLVGVSLLDLGRESASSVYHYFDPAASWRSLGVYSVLKEMELCRQWGLRWYYLGLWVRDCSHLAYKAQYRPHERLVGGKWIEGEP